MAGERRLLVRGFPHWLRASEKKSLLRHFGATEVAVLPTRGKMRNCVFATFGSQEEAKRALSKLHQLEVLGSPLVVEFAHSDRHSQLLQQATPHGSGGRTEESEEAPPSPKPATPTVLPPPPPPPPPPVPRLSYSYPPPSPSTLTNITHTLVTIPKFYEQVLHLMNVMNLPPPFGPVTPVPPGLLEGEGEGESEAESEIGSDGGGDRETNPERCVVREVKRRAAHLATSRGASPPAKRRRHKLPHFDTQPPLAVAAAAKISMNVPSKIEPRPPPEDSTVVSMATSDSSFPQVFGKSSHVQKEADEEEEEEEEGEVGEGEVGEGERFISSEELARNRLSEKELHEYSVFRGYSPGEPSLRLYIKNLSRLTTEKDLRHVYGRYIDWSNERERAVFDVRLMQTGRMKGQAFVGLPSEEKAALALRDTNGYQLSGRPMVVNFARTAKAQL